MYVKWVVGDSRLSHKALCRYMASKFVVLVDANQDRTLY